ncbi:MAG: hypothetical protein H8E80_08215 [Desulfobacteraceae bacterium]|uniref:Uncharacterized protein n=1 Tax=Candidatus Desulfaltia bathyphila TaxID=2841697 RepID=A0A8J6TAV7_9BACT|nr:hypothetical protein [Candidatus Desulfaltia bathyphila]
MEEQLELLIKLYENLKTTFIRNHKGKDEKSIYFSLLNLGSKTKRMRILQKAAVPAMSLNNKHLELLINLNYVEYIDKKRDICFTSFGIWKSENILDVIDTKELLDFIDNKWFNCFADFNRPLSDKEKVILFTLLSVRAFSKNSAVELKNENCHDGWAKALNLSFDFLHKKQIISDKNLLSSMTKETKSLQPVIHFFRYSEYLPKQTNGIFIARGNNSYYLDLYKHEKIDVQSLIFLFEIIFQDKMDFVLMDKTNEHCQKTSYDISIKVFTLDKHIFSTLDYDDLVKQTLRRIIVSPTLKF